MRALVLLATCLFHTSYCRRVKLASELIKASEQLLDSVESITLPEPQTTCDAKRPDGVVTAPMYCTQSQGFACEVFDVKFQMNGAHITIWNSYGCGCDWSRYKSVKWTFRKRPNGPRIWTADVFESAATPNPSSIDDKGHFVTKDWDGIDYRYGAELDVPWSTITKNIVHGNQPWTFSTIERTGARIWKSGRQVYEIITDDGQVFIMQAISMQIDETQTNNEGLLTLPSRPLPSTGKPMVFPTSWTYRCKILAEDLVLRSSGSAIIMQDDFYNNYMKENVEAKYSDAQCVAETEQWRQDYCGRSPGENMTAL